MILITFLHLDHASIFTDLKDAKLSHPNMLLLIQQLPTKKRRRVSHISKNEYKSAIPNDVVERQQKDRFRRRHGSHSSEEVNSQRRLHLLYPSQQTTFLPTMPLTILPFIQQIMIRYIMSTYLGLGIIGNICNLIVFLKPTQHRTSCSIYLIALSVFAIIYLLWSVVPLLYTLDHVDPQIQSLVYCKIRLYGSHVLGQYVRFTIVFACADRYFLARTSARIRAWSSIQMAWKLILIMCIVWLIAGSHLPVFMTIRGRVCGMFDFYKFFYPIYQTIFVGIIPPVLMSVFGFLTIQSLYQRHADNIHVRQRDRDLMRMLVAEIMINIFTSIAFSGNLLYGTATFFVVNKSALRLEIEGFVNFLSQFLIHLLSVTPFYLYIIASQTFRREFYQIIMGCWYKYILRRARVAPFNVQTTAVTRRHTDYR